MWDGYDLNVWFREQEEAERRQAFGRLLTCLHRATGGLFSAPANHPERSPVDPKAAVLAESAREAPQGRFNIYSEWRTWVPNAEWPLQSNHEAERRRGAKVLHVRDPLPVHAHFNTHGDTFMPIAKAGDAYVHLGDGIADDGLYRLWSFREDARQKRDENRRCFRTFLCDVIQTVRPAHLLVTPWTSVGEGVDASLLVFHQDPREFLRDLLRCLYLMEDKLRLWVEKSPDYMPETRIDYMGQDMRSPEQQANEYHVMQRRCVERIGVILEQQPQYLFYDPAVSTSRLAWFQHAERIAEAILSRTAEKVGDVMDVLSQPPLERVGDGWLLMSQEHPMLVAHFYDALAGEVVGGSFSELPDPRT